MIEIFIVNMYKKDRVYVKEVYVVGFVFCIIILKDVFEVFDLFLELLMNDLVIGFIDGFWVFYFLDLNISNFDLGKMFIIRVLLLCWIVDYLG